MSNIPKRTDEAAFPRPTQYREPNQDNVLLPAQWGLTKREYFAAMAMQGILASGTNPGFIELGRHAVEAADNVLLAIIRAERS